MTFRLVKQEFISEYNTQAKLYIHEITGARLLSLTNQDENKVFGINFRTPPKTSNGIAHILEHSVLCGSEKYPVKEPFVEIIKGSLQTFVNAFTYPDKTCYPCASQNLHDFYNLIDIYLDAALHPLISEMTLLQEGWHYELENLEQPLKFKGVVFNEMKGAYSSPDDLLMDKSRNSLFPDNAYGLDSGGDPLVIPDLSYSEFKRFHEDYYHPSNSFVFFYGDDPEEERLKIMDMAFAGFSKKSIDSTIPNQADFNSPVDLQFNYDSAGSEEAKHYITKNWKISDANDLETTFAFQLLDHILLGTPASIIKRRLMESGLGEEVIGGFEAELAETMYTIGLKGVSQENLNQVKELIQSILEEIIRDGLDIDSINASLNTLEFANRELNTGRFPRGLALMLTALRVWLYGGDPIRAMRFENDFIQMREKVQNKEYLTGLVRRYLLENKNAATVTLNPDPNEGNRREKVEQDRLAKVKESLSKDQLTRIIEVTKELKKRQETPDSEEALASIPALSIEDLDKFSKLVTSSEKDGVFHHDIPTNGIFYLDIGFDMSGIPIDLIPYVGLLGKVLLEMGTAKRDYIELTQKIGLETGGIRVAHLLSEKYQQDGQSLYFFLRSKSLPNNAAALFDLLQEILTSPQFNQRDRFKQLLTERRSALEAALIPSGHITINQRLKGHFTQADYIQELISGIDQIYFLRDLGHQVEHDWTKIVSNIERLLKLLVRRNGMVLNVTIDGDKYHALKSEITHFINRFSSTESSIQIISKPVLPKNEGFTLPSQVNYVGSGYNLYRDGAKLSGAWLVANNYLQSTYLWDRVRVQGGAYGGFSIFDPISGVFNYVSYRDPNLMDTVLTFDGASRFLSKLSISPAELKKAIIGTIGDLDAYQLPDAKGWSKMTRMLVGYPEEERQRIRDEVFTTTSSRINQFGVLLEQLSMTSEQVILGSGKSFEGVSAIKGNEIIIKNIL
ncbi:MAG TPA: insulinase family protein [Anaerolineales bacterium]|nr:insulinase family protein [Anaerolineales bacterium]